MTVIDVAPGGNVRQAALIRGDGGNEGARMAWISAALAQFAFGSALAPLIRWLH
jgi:hypothetical protein